MKIRRRRCLLRSLQLGAATSVARLRHARTGLPPTRNAGGGGMTDEAQPAKSEPTHPHYTRPTSLEIPNTVPYRERSAGVLPQLHSKESRLFHPHCCPVDGVHLRKRQIPLVRDLSDQHRVNPRISNVVSIRVLQESRVRKNINVKKLVIRKCTTAGKCNQRLAYSQSYTC